MTQGTNWRSEFKEFVNAEESAPPLALSREVMSRVRRELTPSPLAVFLKVALCASFAGAFSLSFCPQFGMGPAEHSNVHHLFMSLGPIGCSLACGAFFMVLGCALAMAVLRPEEIRLVRTNKVLLVSALSALSLSAFICLGAAVFFEGALVWFLGSWIGGFISIEVAAMVVLRNRSGSPVRT